MSDQVATKRQGMTYVSYIDGWKPFALDVTPPNANCCQNCALYLPAGPAGCLPTLTTTAPERLTTTYRAKRGASPMGPQEQQQVKRFEQFAQDVGWCMAHAPGPKELGPSGLTHCSWWCGHFAAAVK